jgi:hypothetical protein
MSRNAATARSGEHKRRMDLSASAQNSSTSPLFISTQPFPSMISTAREASPFSVPISKIFDVRASLAVPSRLFAERPSWWRACPQRAQYQRGIFEPTWSGKFCIACLSRPQPLAFAWCSDLSKAIRFEHPCVTAARRQGSDDASRNIQRSQRRPRPSCAAARGWGRWQPAGPRHSGP